MDQVNSGFVKYFEGVNLAIFNAGHWFSRKKFEKKYHFHQMPMFSPICFFYRIVTSVPFFSFKRIKHKSFNLFSLFHCSCIFFQAFFNYEFSLRWLRGFLVNGIMQYNMDPMIVLEKAMETWSSWAESQYNPKRTTFFRSFEPFHGSVNLPQKIGLFCLLFCVDLMCSQFLKNFSF